MLWPGHLCLGVPAGTQAGVPLVLQTNTAAAQLPRPALQFGGLGASLEPPPKLCLPLPWSPRPGLRLLKRLQPLSDLILLLFSSAPLWGPARPPKKPRPAPGDRDLRGVGGRILSPLPEGSWRRRGFSGVAAGVAAPRNKSSVRLAASAAPCSCWGGFSRP